jgi:hypothetical protein
MLIREVAMYKKVEKCRICGNKHLELVLDLGEQMLTGVFPREKGAKVTTGPLRLVKCMGGDDACGLLQMEHSYDLGEILAAMIAPPCKCIPQLAQN